MMLKPAKTAVLYGLLALAFVSMPAVAQDFGGILANPSSFPSTGDTGDTGQDPSERFSSLKEQLGQRRETEKQDIDALNSQLLQSQIDNLDNPNAATDTSGQTTDNEGSAQTAAPLTADQAFSFILPDASASPQGGSQNGADPTMGGLLAP